MTVHEYFLTPETVLPQELVYGAMRVAESPTTSHQQAVGELFVELRAHVRARELGSVWIAPLDVVLDRGEALVVQPDLFVILTGGVAVVEDKVFGAPDLVIEVLSPNPRIGETAERLEWFRHYGVRECWLVDQTERRVEVVQFIDRQVASRRTFTRHESIASSVLPEFTRSLTAMLGY